MADPFANHRDAALAVLSSDGKLTPKAGRFLGQIVVDPSLLTKKQADWLDCLLKRAGFSPFVGGRQ